MSNQFQTRELPGRPNLEHLRSQAKDLLSSFRAGEPEAIARVSGALPSLAELSAEHVAKRPLGLADAQSALAREYGFKSWQELVREVQRIRSLEGITQEVADAFVARTLSDQVGRCRRFLELYPELPKFSAATSLVWGEFSEIRSRLATDPQEFVSTRLGPNDWLPLQYVCHSMAHHLDVDRSEALLDAARLLLDAGADPNTSFTWTGDGKSQISVLYGAAGATGHVGIVRLLLERGANPNDGESIPHAAQHDREEILQLLMAHGGDGSSLMGEWGTTPMYFLAGHRPSDPGWAVAMKGIHWLLEHGADPNVRCYKVEETVLHCACRTMNSDLVADLLSHGADPRIKRADGRTAFDLASITGNFSAAESLREADGANELLPNDAVLAACAADDLAGARAILAAHPELEPSSLDLGTWALVKFAEYGVTAGLRNLLELGNEVGGRGEDGATALHYACFCGWADCVDLLLKRGAPLEIEDSTYHANPLGWAIQGTGWHRNPKGDYVRIVQALLDEGADREQLKQAIDRSEEHAELLKELLPLIAV